MENHAGHSLPVLGGQLPESGPTLRVVPEPPSNVSLSARTIWSAICNGELRIVELRHESRSTWVMLRRQPVPALRASELIQGRKLRVWELVLSGTSENATAIELRLAASTVSQELKQVLTRLGLAPRLSAIPLPICQLYRAAVDERLLDARLDATGSDARHDVIVVLPRPELALASLAPTERLVCQLLIEGKTHAQIAAQRGTSVRTVANQISSVFSKLRVSGRLELMSLLASGRDYTRPPRRREKPTQPANE